MLFRSFGACLEFIQYFGYMDTALAAEMGISWLAPTQQLSLMGRYSSAAFLPLNTITQGNILEPMLSGLYLISLDYTARLHRSLSLGLESVYFIQSYVYDSEGRFWGAEVFGSFFWNPFSDLSINLGAGAFFPSLGNAVPNTDVLWRIRLNVIISFL